MKNQIYGYTRISRKTQNIDRQIRNILAEYPNAKISKEAYTGTKIDGRKEFEKILKQAQKGDTIVFDSVSRMARNAAEGIKLYFELYDRGVDLVFLKESHINTRTYKTALEQNIEKTGNEIADIYIEATNKVIRILAQEQIKQAFEQAQKEVDDLHERTREGMETARRNGKQIGLKAGSKLVTKKSIEKKEEIKKHSKDFGGSLNDIDCMKLTGIARGTYYKYKRELKAELESMAK